MSVLIKGMEMPKSCDSCRLMMLTDTNCAPKLYCGCPIVFKAHPQGIDHRPDWCPLVPVPPHGRLIDADAFEKENAYFWGRDFINAKYEDCLCDLVNAAPTIIPASKEET